MKQVFQKFSNFCERKIRRYKGHDILEMSYKKKQKTKYLSYRLITELHPHKVGQGIAYFSPLARQTLRLFSETKLVEEAVFITS